MKFDPAMLQAGDCLLYRPRDFFGYLIALKTWTRVAHVEIYAGDGKSWASRDGIGVGRFPLRTAQLGVVRRVLPGRGTLDLVKLTAYARGSQGQGYDWRGLATFALLTKSGEEGKQFCSEFATNAYRAGGFDPVNPEIAADTVAPSEFYESVGFQTVWEDFWQGSQNIPVRAGVTAD